jgi:hypothetical protein
MIQTMTVGEYAKIRGIKPQGVRQAKDRGHRLPGIISFVKIGRDYVLTVDVIELDRFIKENATKMQK